VIKSITQPIAWEDKTVRVSASLGISVAPTDGSDPETLLKKADEAMYVAKKSGKNGYSFANESTYFE
jgi:diguanylate cyclase (GGDEF)-like protein